MPIEQWYTEKEVCERLKIGRSVLWRLREQGEIGFIPVGRQVRYTERHIADYVARRERQPRVERVRAS
jgi:excisionase family DNA binding protein